MKRVLLSHFLSNIRVLTKNKAFMISNSVFRSTLSVCLPLFRYLKEEILNSFDV